MASVAGGVRQQGETSKSKGGVAPGNNNGDDVAVSESTPRGAPNKSLGHAPYTLPTSDCQDLFFPEFVEPSRQTQCCTISGELSEWSSSSMFHAKRK